MLVSTLFLLAKDSSQHMNTFLPSLNTLSQCIEPMCMCVCVSERERKRERERVTVCVQLKLQSFFPVMFCKFLLFLAIGIVLW